jgi:putative glutamine amidotransferase
MKKVTIGFSRATSEERYQLYIDWLKSIEPDFEYVNFYGNTISEALDLLENCSGFVLTGGADIHPSFYNRPDEAHKCEIDTYRDTLEFPLIEKALEMKLPLLAICRGEQILNISQGGDLIVDIEADYDSTINHKSEKDQSNYHKISIDTSSDLFKISHVNFFDIVTSHHQAVKTLAACFKPVAFADDGILEAYEWKNPEGKGYLSAVQWHPEKGDYINYLSHVIGKEFLRNVYLFSNKEK